MIWQPFLLVFPGLLALASTDVSLEAFARQTMSVGTPNRVPGPIAELIDVEPDAPVHQLKVTRDQTTDGMNRLLEVIVELSTSTPRRPIKPIGLVLSTYRARGRSTEDYVFRAGLDGTLERASLTLGANDDEGKAIKGSGTVKKQDPNDPGIQDRFQHELDLWLKRRHLKKEWRTAEFSGGILKKRSKRK